MDATNQNRLSGQRGVRVWVGFKAVTHVGVGVHVAVDVEDRQDVYIHLVEQAGHCSVAAKGVQSLETELRNGAINTQEPVALVHRCYSPL